MSTMSQGIHQSSVVRNPLALSFGGLVHVSFLSLYDHSPKLFVGPALSIASAESHELGSVPHTRDEICFTTKRY